MDKLNLDEYLKSALVELQEYLNLQLRYNKLLLTKRLGEVSSYFTLFLLLLGIGGFFLFFLSFAFVEWFNEYYLSKFYGYLIVSGFYLLLFLFLIIFRKTFIFNPLRKLFGEIMVGGENENAEDILAFRSKAKFTSTLKKQKKVIDEKEKELRSKFETLGGQLTISNIIQTVAMNAYASFVTTSGIAKLAYNLMKRFTRRKKKTKRISKKNQRNIEEGDEYSTIT